MSPPRELSQNIVLGVDFSTGEDESAVVVMHLNGRVVGTYPMTPSLFQMLSRAREQDVSFGYTVARGEPTPMPHELAAVGEIQDATIAAHEAAAEILAPVTYTQELRIDADLLREEITPEVESAVRRACERITERFAAQAFGFAPRELVEMLPPDRLVEPGFGYVPSPPQDFVDFVNMRRPICPPTVAGAELERVAAIYGLARRNEPGGDPEADDDFRRRVRERIYGRPFVQHGDTFTWRGMDDGPGRFTRPEGSRAWTNFTDGQPCPDAVADAAVRETEREPRALYDGPAGCPCPTCSQPTADRQAPDFAKPLAPLPEWMKKVDEVLADAAPAPFPVPAPTQVRAYAMVCVRVPVMRDGDVEEVVVERQPGESDLEFGTRVHEEVERRRQR